MFHHSLLARDVYTICYSSVQRAHPRSLVPELVSVGGHIGGTTTCTNMNMNMDVSVHCLQVQLQNFTRMMLSVSSVSCWQQVAHVLIISAVNAACSPTTSALAAMLTNAVQLDLLSTAFIHGTRVY